MADKNTTSQECLTKQSELMAFSLMDFDCALKYLKEDFKIRKLDEELNKAIKGHMTKTGRTKEDAIQLLNDAFTKGLVDKWLDKDTGTSWIYRDTAIKIAFILQMSVNEAGEFLNGCWHNGFYMRDYKDLIYLYCLEKGYCFEKAIDFIEKYKYLDKPNLKNEGTDKGKPLTALIADGFAEAKLNDELFGQFLSKNEASFGSFRRKAYEWFFELYEEIKIAGNNRIEWGDSKDKIKGIHTHLASQIRFGLPEKPLIRKGFEHIAKIISKNIPSRQTLSKILNCGKNQMKAGQSRGEKGITQVDRKHIILVWILCLDNYLDNKHFRNSIYEMTESERKEAFRDCYNRINLNVLAECGMPMLDARNPFDWIIMNALRYYYCPSNDEEIDVPSIKDFFKDFIEDFMMNLFYAEEQHENIT